MNSVAGESFFDAHAHYSFAPDVVRFGAWVTKRTRGAFSTTVSPEDFLFAREVFSEFPSIKVGLGAHPWWVSQGMLGENDCELLTGLVRDTQFIGEVGLDFGRNGLANSVFATDEETKEAQLEVFKTILSTCQNHPDSMRVFSFHAVRSADVIMDLLEHYSLFSNNTIIFHWFSGSSSQLKRARDLGCMFSVNANMLSTKRGREYVKAIPAEQLLIETDLPEENPQRSFEDICNEYFAALEEAYKLLTELRGEDILESVAANARRIFG